MAFKIISVNEVVGSEIGLGIGLSNEFNNLNNVNYVTRDQVIANVKNLLLTRKGERYELPTFGTDLLKLLFDPISDDLELEIQTIVNEALSQWLPYVSVENIEFRSNALDPNEKHSIFIRLNLTFNQFETAAITITLDEPGILGIE
jgi:phage baseplate assembly protein W